MDLLQMLEQLKLDNSKIFETNNGDLVGFFDGQELIFSCGSPFTITPYKLNSMTFEEIK